MRGEGTDGHKDNGDDAKGSTWTASITATDASYAGFGGSMTASLNTTQHTSTPSNHCSSRTDIYGYTYQTCNNVTNDYSMTEGNATY